MCVCVRDKCAHTFSLDSCTHLIPARSSTLDRTPVIIWGARFVALTLHWALFRGLIFVPFRFGLPFCFHFPTSSSVAFVDGCFVFARVCVCLCGNCWK